MINYKGLKGTLEKRVVPDAQVDREMDNILEHSTRRIPVTDRPSQLDDELVLDYAGFCDGVQFEGGTAQEQTLVLGSGAFIPGFEDQLVGKRPGDDAEVRVTFPIPYHSESLAGKEAVFKCHVRAVNRLEKPEPNDAFAREAGGFDSFREFREALRRGIQDYVDRQADEELKLHLLDQLLEDYACEIDPDQLKRAAENELKALENQLAQQGLTLAAYSRFTGKSREQLLADCEPDARKSVKRSRIIAEIAQAEAIQADENSMTEAIRRICIDNRLTPEQLMPKLDEAAMRVIAQNVVTDKVLNLIRDSAQITVVERKD